MVLANFGVWCGVILGIGIKKVFFGRLRGVEYEVSCLVAEAEERCWLSQCFKDRRTLRGARAIAEREELRQVRKIEDGTAGIEDLGAQSGAIWWLLKSRM